MSQFHKRLALFRLQPFRWFAMSCFFTMFGAGLNYITITWMIVRAHVSVGAVAILMCCFWLPGMITGLYVGALVDRYPRKWIIMGSIFVRGSALLIFGWHLHQSFSSTAIYLLALIMGTCFSFYGPAAMRIVREIVPEQDLLYANSTIDVVYESANVIGMGSAGLLISLFSGPMVVMMDGMLFMIAMFCILMIRSDLLKLQKQFSEKRQPVLIDIKNGLNYILSKKVLMVIYTLQLLILVEVMITPVLLAPFAKSVLHATAAQFGDIEASLSIGIIIGGLFIPWFVERFGLMRTLFVLVITLGVCYLAFSYNHYIRPAESLYFIIGFALAVWPIIVTKAQENTDIEYQGRVQSMYNSLAGFIMIVVYLILKLVGSYIQVTDLYWIEIVLTLGIVILLWKNWRTL